MTRLNIGDLFRRPYEGQWGLRGDPYMWEMLWHRLEQAPMPVNPIILTDLLIRAFQDASGVSIRKQEPVYLNFVNSGHGISTGMVSPQWWAATGVPVLIDRAWGMGAFRGYVEPQHNSQMQMVEVLRLSIRRTPTIGQ